MPAFGALTVTLVSLWKLPANPGALRMYSATLVLKALRGLVPTNRTNPSSSFTSVRSAFEPMPSVVVPAGNWTKPIASAANWSVLPALPGMPGNRTGLNVATTVCVDKSVLSSRSNALPSFSKLTVSVMKPPSGSGPSAASLGTSVPASAPALDP